MDGHYIHLLSNHFPLILSITGFIVLTAGLFLHIDMVKKVALYIFIAASIFTIPAYVSGEEAEHKVEEYPTTSESTIEEHEERAETVLILTDLLGVLSIASLLFITKNHRFSVWSNRIVWALSFVCILLLINVNKTGGAIRRPELRKASTEQISDTVEQTNHEED